jgi:F-box/leucine-rich repeat protein 2/20
MDLPLELPQELHHLRIAADSSILMEMLSNLPPDLITFFEFACEDPAWCALHQDFMKNIIRWITLRSFNETLSEDFAKRAADAIRNNFAVVRPYLYYNLDFQVEGKEIPQNSLLWATTSDYFHKLIRTICREKNAKNISMGNISLEIFDQIQEFVETGNVDHLWRKSEREILEVFRDASEWDIPGLMVDCEILLKNYIDVHNVFDRLITAHRNRWLHLKLTCMEFINNLKMGLHFDIDRIQVLAVDVLNFQRPTANKFELLKDVITHLNLGDSLAEQAEFSEWIYRCTHLVGIGFAGSLEFSEKFLDIPENIQDLDLSRCVWLNGEYLRKFPLVAPRIKSLNLTSNYDLAYDDWAALIDFKSLEALEISRCHQIQDEDIHVIFRACRGLKKLTMIDCLQIDETMFIQIARAMSGLTDLNISRCNITDAALIDLSTKCQSLVTLNISRCPDVSEKGIIEAVRQMPFLQELDVTYCHIPAAAIKMIKNIKPTLKVVV